MRVTILICLLAMLPAKALAWAGEGHKAVAQVALDILHDSSDPHAQRAYAAVQTILMAQSQIDAAYPPRPRLNSNNDMVIPALVGSDVADAATWPDRIKSFSFYDGWKPWHYKDVGIAFDGTAVPSGYENAEYWWADAASAEYMIYAISRNDLRDNLTQAQRIAFIEHIVGDIYQPLHNATLFGSGFKNDGDTGGNAFYVIFENGSTHHSNTESLHTYWDKIFYYHGIGDDDNYQALVDDVQTHYQLNLPTYPLGAADQMALLSQWVTDSSTLARNNVYWPLVSTYHLDQPNAQKPDKTHALGMPQAYYSDSIDLAELRIAEGAQSLASVLVYMYGQDPLEPTRP